MTNLSIAERKRIIEEIESAVADNSLSIGEAIRRIRTELYGMTQTRYATFTRVSDKTLRDIEKGNTDPRLSVVSKLLAPGGFQLSARFFKRVI